MNITKMHQRLRLIQNSANDLDVILHGCLLRTLEEAPGLDLDDAMRREISDRIEIIKNIAKAMQADP